MTLDVYADLFDIDLMDVARLLDAAVQVEGGSVECGQSDAGGCENSLKWRNMAVLAYRVSSGSNEDVDCFDMNDVIWAMNTRFQGDADIITIPGVRCHPLDPSNDPTCDPSIRDHGIACKTIFDCTVPYDQKARFQRARFMDVDPAHWVTRPAADFAD